MPCFLFLLAAYIRSNSINAWCFILFIASLTSSRKNRGVRYFVLFVVNSVRTVGSWRVSIFSKALMLSEVFLPCRFCMLASSASIIPFAYMIDATLSSNFPINSFTLLYTSSILFLFESLFSFFALLLHVYQVLFVSFSFFLTFVVSKLKHFRSAIIKYVVLFFSFLL